MKVRTKPVVKEAIQWDETRTTLRQLDSLGMLNVVMSLEGYTETHPNHEQVFNLRIKTLEGTMRVSKGDWIIKGVNGEFYPCKPDIFEKTYEAVE